MDLLAAQGEKAQAAHPSPREPEAAAPAPRTPAPAHRIVYSSVPSSSSRSSLFGVVMLCAMDFFPLWKNVSGVQILLARRLLSGRRCMGPLNRSLSSFQLWRKNTSMVYS